MLQTKQLIVSRSSSEAEQKDLSSVTCELQWILYLLKDFNVTCTRPRVLYHDSQSVSQITYNPVFHERTKNLEIDCHLVIKEIQKGILNMLPISTNDLADFLTKSLVAPKFQLFIFKLGMFNIYHASSCGRILRNKESNGRSEEKN